MPDTRLTSRSGLEHLTSAGRRGAATAEPGVTIGLRNIVALATVIARKNRVDDIAEKVRSVFALDLPLTPRRVEAGAVTFIWAGPAHWLAATETMSGHAWEAELRRHFAGLAAVSDQSDACVMIRVAGPAARAALAKGVPVDLHPRAFRPDDTACTMAGLIGVQLWQIDETPTYDILVFRSFAASLWQWLTAASAEFGVVIADSG